ncbi:hypothetical protein CPC08DRAFT_24466 [Agrocybe pediades]|nr:hypothetical protein CPC08DRAFT_24466 [Agrocybe pediades]
MSNHLPASFRSLYRLYLRTSSASVLHQRQAKKNLAQRWRPIFDAGANVVRELQNKPKDASPAWVQSREEWLKVWNKRLDNTLQLLYTSSQSRGLPHRITRNLGFMVANGKDRALTKLVKLPKWDPQKKTPPTSKELVRMEARRKEEEFHDNASKALDEVMRFAESYGPGLTLGRYTPTIRRVARRTDN